MLAHQSHVTRWDPATGTGGYDREDNALAYGYSAINGLGQWHTTTYKVTYLKQDGYLEQATRGTSDDPSVLATTATSLYDAFGRRIAIDTVSTGQSTHQVRAFAFDAEGEILERRDGSATGSSFTVTANGGYATQHYAYVAGRAIGSVDEHGSIDVLSGVTGFSNSTQGTSSYVVQAGDTLQSIAQAVYGDASLWYVVAGANGLTGDGDLASGQTLKLPQVTTHSNTAETFKPYNPREIAGSTTPALPQAPMPAPSNHHCNTVAAIIVIAVVVVASIYTAGLASQSLVYGASSSVWTAGTTALAGGYGGAGAAAAAIGAAAGNAAGQLAGDATGVHSGFSLTEALGAGLGAGITAGLAGEISGGTSIANLAKQGLAGEARIAGIGAASAAGGYAGNKIVGQPAHFSWANIAAAALSTEATTALGLNGTLAQKWGQAAGGSFAGNLAGGLVNGALASEATRLLGGNAANGRHIFEDAFGNALGNAAIADISAANAESQRRQQAQPVSSLLAPDNPNSAVNPVAAYLSGPYAHTGDDAEMLARYNPFNGPLLASSDRASMLAGVYGPAEYPSLSVAQANDVRSMQGDAPWLNSGEWSSDVFQTYIDANGDVNVIGNPVYDAAGMPVMQNGQQVVVVPGGASVTPSAEVLAQLRSDGSGPPIAPPYWVGKGYFASTYDTAVAGASDPNNTLFQRGVFGTLAIAEGSLMLAEETARGVLNAPAQATIAWQAFRAAAATPDSFQRWNYIAQGLGASGQAMLGAFPIASTIEGAVARSMLSTDAAVASKIVSNTPVVDAGIAWGRGIQGQGMPWEEYLAGQLPREYRLPANFKTFDFYGSDTGVAISAKTLDTTTASRLADPTRVYYSLKSNVDDVLSFDTPYTLSKTTVDPDLITSRELRVAVPPEPTPAQWQQIERVIQYGQNNRVKVIVTPAH